jgi:hypothetical protein
MPLILLLLAVAFVAKFFWWLVGIAATVVGGPVDRLVVGATG